MKVRLETEWVSALVTTIRQKRDAVSALASDRDEKLPRASGNRWIDASEFLLAFPHLSLPPAKRLACMYSAWPSERDSRLLVVDLPPGEALPDIPKSLESFEINTLFPDESKLKLPRWISKDVMQEIVGDGSSESLFERSMMSRWVMELLNFGHNVFWPRHTVLLAAPPEYTDWDRVRDRSKPRWKVCDGEALPDDWRPSVTMRATKSTPDAPLPRAEEGRAALGDSPFDAVEFFAYTLYGTATTYRYRDWYRNDAFIGGEYYEIAQGGGAYLV